LQEQIQNLEAKRISLIHKLGLQNSEKLNHKNEASGWSILQILEHVVLVEEKSVANAIYKLSSPKELKPVSLFVEVRLLIVRVTFLFGIKFKSPKEVAPGDEISFLDLVNRWEIARIKLQELSPNALQLLSLGIFKHPVIGYLNYKQMVQFLDMHFHHHLAQVSSLYEKAPSSKNTVPKPIMAKV
jgi:hypothetical protein